MIFHDKKIKDFEGYRSLFILRKKDFKIVIGGSSYHIISEDHQYNFLDKQDVRGKGFHLCKIVRVDVEKFIELHPDYPYDQYNVTGINTQSFSLENINKNIGKDIYSIDVDDCYWDTIYKMGAISKLTYLKGLKKPEWKTGRNASIGALHKTERVITYVGGEVIDNSPADKNAKTAGVRADVVGTVHEMFLELIELLGDGFLMYFTDCVYVTQDKIKVAEDFLTARGYQTKRKTYCLDIVNDRDIIWHDYQKNIAKSYRYSREQTRLTVTEYSDRSKKMLVGGI